MKGIIMAKSMGKKVHCEVLTLRSAGALLPCLRSVITLLHPFVEALLRFEALALPLTCSGAF
jgi:hypothetical protein